MLESEPIPIFGRIELEERNRRISIFVDDPLKRQLTRLARNHARDDWSMTRCDNVQGDLGLAFNLDDLFTVLRPHPTLRSKILPLVIEFLDKHILDRRTKIRESPCDVAIVPDNDVWHAGQRDACDVEVTANQMGLIPC